jgi:hypothetical protein
MAQQEKPTEQKQDELPQQPSTYTQFIRINPMAQQQRNLAEDKPVPLTHGPSNFTILQQHQVVRGPAYNQT